MKVESGIYNLWIISEDAEDVALLQKLWDRLPEKACAPGRTVEKSPEDYKWGLGVPEDEASRFGVGFDGKTLHFRGY